MIRRKEESTGHDDCDTWVPPRRLRYTESEDVRSVIQQGTEDARNAWKKWKDDSVFCREKKPDLCQGK